MDPIYLDHHATTPIDPQVIDYMSEIMRSTYGNASSQHHFGHEAKKLVEASRKIRKSRNGPSDESELSFMEGRSCGSLSPSVYPGLFLEPGFLPHRSQ